jgi:hypothetical protein
MGQTPVRIGQYLLTAEDLPKRAGIRWALGSPNTPRSSTWRLWGDKKGDVYLAVRSLGGVVKASFHKDRRCSVGFTKEYERTASERFGGDNRHWERWALPDQEVVRAAHVVIPGSELRVFESDDASQMRWLPAATPGRAAVVSIFIAEPPSARSWPGPESGTEVIGVMSVPSRFTWVVYAEQELDQQGLAMISDARAKAIQHLPSPLPHDSAGLRTMIWGTVQRRRIYSS